MADIQVLETDRQFDGIQITPSNLEILQPGQERQIQISRDIAGNTIKSGKILKVLQPC